MYIKILADVNVKVIPSDCEISEQKICKMIDMRDTTAMVDYSQVPSRLKETVRWCKECDTGRALYIISIKVISQFLVLMGIIVQLGNHYNNIITSKH